MFLLGKSLGQGENIETDRFVKFPNVRGTEHSSWRTSPWMTLAFMLSRILDLFFRIMVYAPMFIFFSHLTFVCLSLQTYVRTNVYISLVTYEFDPRSLPSSDAEWLFIYRFPFQSQLDSSSYIDRCALIKFRDDRFSWLPLATTKNQAKQKTERKRKRATEKRMKNTSIANEYVIIYEGARSSQYPRDEYTEKLTRCSHIHIYMNIFICE